MAQESLPPDEAETWVRVRDVARALLVNPETVRRWLRQGLLAGYSLGPRAGWRIRRRDLDRFLQHRRRPGAPAAVAPSDAGPEHAASI